MKNRMTLTASLPPVNTRRWNAHRKLQLVTAVSNGDVQLDDICRRYSISSEEFQSWREAYSAGGLEGLYVTRRRRLS